MVEPSFESLEIADRIQKIAVGMQKSAAAVLNKIPSSKIAGQLKEKLRERGIHVIGTLPNDPLVFEAGFVGHGLKKGNYAGCGPYRG